MDGAEEGGSMVLIAIRETIHTQWKNSVDGVVVNESISLAAALQCLRAAHPSQPFYAFASQIPCLCRSNDGFIRFATPARPSVGRHTKAEWEQFE